MKMSKRTPTLLRKSSLPLRSRHRAGAKSSQKRSALPPIAVIHSPPPVTHDTIGAIARRITTTGVLVVDEPTRKLAVLLHADVVGSTTLVQVNETLVHRRTQDALQRS